MWLLRLERVISVDLRLELKQNAYVFFEDVPPSPLHRGKLSVAWVGSPLSGHTSRWGQHGDVEFSHCGLAQPAMSLNFYRAVSAEKYSS